MSGTARPGNPRPNLARGRWTGWLYLLGYPLPVILFALTVAGIGTVPAAGVGLLILAMCLPATRALTNLYRRDAARMLGEPVPAPYRSIDTSTGNWVTRVGRRAGDPQRWRDLLWLFAASTVGIVLSSLSVAFFLTIPWYLIQPFLMAVTPEGIFDTNYGIVNVDSVATSFLQWVFVPVGAALWWYVSPRLMQLHALLNRALLGPTRPVREQMLRERVSELAESRSEAVDVQAAELRRIERDLHDGAQARLVASGMTLGMAAETLENDPEAAKALLEEAQATTVNALEDLRTVVRGIHPPVLSDRGLVGAIQALAIEMAVPVQVTAELDGRPPAPVESAVYFAVAECLANVGKHAKASRTAVMFDHRDGALHVGVEDDGVGGAKLDAAAAGGLAGIQRRLAVFDGTLDLTSPAGGPTKVAMMVPCELSSART